MNHDELYLLLYQRVKEIQPQLTLLVNNFKNMGMTPDEINTEICFAIMHEGYQLHYLEKEIKNQTHIDTQEEKQNETNT